MKRMFIYVPYRISMQRIIELKKSFIHIFYLYIDIIKLKLAQFS